jgi:hypothetical protein
MSLVEFFNLTGAIVLAASLGMLFWSGGARFVISMRVRRRSPLSAADIASLTRWQHWQMIGWGGIFLSMVCFAFTV